MSLLGQSLRAASSALLLCTLAAVGQSLELPRASSISLESALRLQAARNLPAYRIELQRAADAGSARAMVRLGVSHYFGDSDFPSDLRLSAEWFKRAADAGSPLGLWKFADTINDLRRAHPGEDFGAHDTDALVQQAVNMARAEASRSPVDSSMTLAWAHGTGLGAVKNFDEALRHLRSAAARGDADAQIDLAKSLSNESEIRSSLARYQPLAAVALLNKAVQAGNARAMFVLALIYLDGRKGVVHQGNTVFIVSPDLKSHEVTTVGVRSDPSRAVALLQSASSLGNTEARATLGTMYFAGRGVPLDYERARGLLEKAATAGNLPAMYNLGLLQFDGRGGPKSEEAARGWWQKAAAGGFQEAKRRLEALDAQR